MKVRFYNRDSPSYCWADKRRYGRDFSGVSYEKLPYGAFTWIASASTVTKAKVRYFFYQIVTFVAILAFMLACMAALGGAMVGIFFLIYLFPWIMLMIVGLAALALTIWLFLP